MKIEQIIDTYGTTADYYDMATGNIFKLSEMTYDKQKNKSIIEVIDYQGNQISFTAIDGDRTRG